MENKLGNSDDTSSIGIEEERLLVVDRLEKFAKLGISQAEVAEKIGTSAGQLTKAKQGKASLGGTVKIRKELTTLLEKKERGESIEPTKISLWQMFTDWSPKFLKKNVRGIILTSILLSFPFFLAFGYKDSWQLAEEISGATLHYLQISCLLNLLISIFFFLHNLSLIVIKTSTSTNSIKQHVRDFSILWCLFWFFLAALYVDLCIIYFFNTYQNTTTTNFKFSIGVNLLWALAELLND